MEHAQPVQVQHQAKGDHKGGPGHRAHKIAEARRKEQEELIGCYLSYHILRKSNANHR